MELARLDEKANPASVSSVREEKASKSEDRNNSGAGKPRSWREVVECDCILELELAVSLGRLIKMLSH